MPRNEANKNNFSLLRSFSFTEGESINLLTLLKDCLPETIDLIKSLPPNTWGPPEVSSDKPHKQSGMEITPWLWLLNNAVMGRRFYKSYTLDPDHHLIQDYALFSSIEGLEADSFEAKIHSVRKAFSALLTSPYKRILDSIDLTDDTPATKVDVLNALKVISEISRQSGNDISPLVETFKQSENLIIHQGD